MIHKLHLLHYLKQDVYQRICEHLDVPDHQQKDCRIHFEKGKVPCVHLYHIRYKDFGHIWFMECEVDFPKFGCEAQDFAQSLYLHYRELFGDSILQCLPAYDELCCNYIEYGSLIPVKILPPSVRSFLHSKCAPEQLDQSRWDQYKTSHGTIAFCLNVGEDGIRTLARCHGTALKKRVTDAAAHKTVGLCPGAAVNQDTEKQIVDWLYEKYHLTGL